MITSELNKTMSVTNLGPDPQWKRSQTFYPHYKCEKPARAVAETSCALHTHIAAFNVEVLHSDMPTFTTRRAIISLVANS